MFIIKNLIYFIIHIAFLKAAAFMAAACRFILHDLPASSYKYGIQSNEILKRTPKASRNSARGTRYIKAVGRSVQKC